MAGRQGSFRWSPTAESSIVVFVAIAVAAWLCGWGIMNLGVWSHSIAAGRGGLAP